MAKLSPFLSKPSEWVEKYAALSAEIKKLEDQKDGLKEKIKLHLKEKGLEVVAGDKHEARLVVSERTDFSQRALAATFGDAWLDEAIVKLPKSKSETFRVVERKADDPKVQEIVDHFTPKAKKAQ